MNEWSGWPPERMVAVYVGAAYALLGLQLTLSHARARFHNPAMWVPVVVTPVLVLGAFAYAITRGAAGLVAPVFGLGLVVGIVGSIFHTRGVLRRPGGFTLRNAMDGPPVLLASAYWALSALALAVHLWSRSA